MGFQTINIKCQKCGCGTSEVIPTEKGTAAMCTQCMNIIKLNDVKTFSNQVKCPKCGSTQITTGARGWRLTTGFIGSGKTVNRCANCGHTWDPKK